MSGDPARLVAHPGWTPPIHKCVSTRNEGVGEIVVSLERHHTWLATPPGQRRRHERMKEELREALRETLIDAAQSSLAAEIEAAVDAVESKSLDPYSATEQLLERFTRGR